MAETSQNWQFDDIIPGEKVVRRAVSAAFRFVQFLPSSEGYPSERREIPNPGELGGVPVRATLLEEANAIIN